MKRSSRHDENQKDIVSSALRDIDYEAGGMNGDDRQNGVATVKLVRTVYLLVHGHLWLALGFLSLIFRDVPESIV